MNGFRLVDVDIADITPSGDGIGRFASQEVVVPFTIPGERVRVRVPDRRGTSLRGTLVAVLAASPHRVQPPCPHFGPAARPGACGGCSWQHISYPEQLRLKTRLVADLLRHALGRPVTVHPALPATDDPAEPWGYRNKVHFVFGNAGRTLVMGHYVRGTRRVIPVVVCPVHDPRGNAIAMRARDALATVGAHAAGRGDGTLRHIAIRVAARTPETMTTLVVTAEDDKRVRSAMRRVLGDGDMTSFHLNVHERDDGFIFGARTRRIAGRDRLKERVADTTFLISPTAFFQTNVRAAEVMVRLVLEAVPAGAAVLDLYAGAGLFALPLARRGHRVVAIEESRQATADGAASARLNGVGDKCRFVTGKVEIRVTDVSPQDAAVIVMDPPRQGCDKRVVDDVFKRLRPERAVYVSCNPVSLARDATAAERYGYRLDWLRPLDMFPHTPHVETIAHMTRTG